jgi:hypothetical protein
MDAKDNLYVTSTTCGRIQQYATSPDPAQDVFVRSVAINTDPATASGIQGKKNHYLTSDWAGRLYATEWGIKFTPKTIQVPATPLPPLAPLPTPDTTPPALVNFTLPAATTTRAVNVSIEATDNVAVAEMRLANEDGVWGPWQPFVTPVLHTISDGYAVKGVYVQVRDMADNRSAAVYKTLRYEKETAPVVQDVADPILSTLAVPALTAVNAVTLSLQASDDVALRNMRFANEDGNWGAWEPYGATKAWNLSAGYGLKLVYAQVSDTSGKLSNVLTARSKVQQDAPLDPPPPNATPDTTAPLLATISLPTETTTQTVPVTLDASDNVAVAQARFANEDGIWGAWRAYTPTTDWLLTANFTTKRVYAQVRDAAGNESLVLSAPTKYVKTQAGPVDQTAPALQSVTVPNPARTQEVTVTLVATDDVGVTQVRLANEDGTWSAWKPFVADVPHQLTAGNTYKVVYAQVRDAAGRESNVLFTRTLLQP